MNALIVVAILATQLPGGRGTGPSTGPLPAVKFVSVGTVVGRPAPEQRGSGSVIGGQEAVLRVELAAPAPCVERCGSVAMNGKASGYMPVTIAASVPAQVPVQRLLVPTGETRGEVRFVTTPVAAPLPITITARSEGSAAQQAVLTVLAPTLSTFVVDRTSVNAGEVIKATATFTGPPASASAVKLQLQTTSSKVLQVPATLALELNKTVISFDIVSLGVVHDESQSVVAFYLDKTLPATIAVKAARLVDVKHAWPCCDNPFRVILSGRPAPGSLVSLTSSNPARATVPATVAVPPESSAVNVQAQIIHGSSDTEVTIAVSYAGETKHQKVHSEHLIKPDLFVTDIALTDRFGTPITAPADGQPFKLCAKVRTHHEDDRSTNVPIPLSVLRISYHTPTGTGTSTGRDIDIPLDFSQTGALQPQCAELPGLAPGSSHDVAITADAKAQVDEKNEGNNTKTLKITRPQA